MLRNVDMVVSDPKKNQFISLLFLVQQDMGELPSSQPKGPEQQCFVSALQDKRVVPIKGNVVARGQNVQDRPEGCILCNSTVSKIQEEWQIPAERPSIRVLLPLLQAFSSSQLQSLQS